MARQHLHALSRLPTPHRVVAVHDASLPAAAEFAALAGASPFASLGVLLAETRPDVVHICTPAGRHFAPAREALEGGAHIYVEKPLVETVREADELLQLAADRGRLVCAGHQVMWDRAFRQWSAGVATLAPLQLVDSHFTFRPPQLRLDRAGATALAEQLVDVLPHPLYTLVAALERFGDGAPALEFVSATATEVVAVIGAGTLQGRLFVSLRARPVASTLSGSGAGGTLTADFVRSLVVGAGNPGTSPIEKIVNPMIEGWQLQSRTVGGLVRRLLAGGGYPGLPDILAEFYGAVRDSGPSPLAPLHLRRVTALYEEIAGAVRRATAGTRPRRSAAPAGPVALVTGARGYLGKEIARHLARRGFLVRGVSRVADADDPSVHEWVHADLSQSVPPSALDGVAVVVHAAAETAGGFDAHERNSIATTEHLVRAMGAANVRRLVYVSSLSVLRPPHTPWERQDERTPLASNPRALGAYTWGKCVAETRVAAGAPALGIVTRIVRPAALIDFDEPELPGLVGRRLFGRWHLGLGRPGVPIAICDVSAAGAAIAWCAEHFDDAPPVVNLIDGTDTTRGDLLRAFRTHGWRGRVVWVPISVLAALLSAARAALALVRLRRPTRLAVWDVLRTRRYDAAVARRLLGLAAGEAQPRPRARTGVLAGVRPDRTVLD